MPSGNAASWINLLVAVVLLTACGSTSEPESANAGTCAAATEPKIANTATSATITRETGLAVSGDGHYLVDAYGAPFVMQADSAWGLVNRGTKTDMIQYLDTRQEQGFNTILLPAIYGFRDDGANAYGEVPFTDTATGQPNEAYWQHVDYIVREIRNRGMRIGMVPAWSRQMLGDGKLISTKTAADFGTFLGKRYGDVVAFWVLGGDDPEWHKAEANELARGIAIGVSGSEDYSKVMMTYHPPGLSVHNSSDQFHNAEWLDFNMVQSGHAVSTIATGYLYTMKDFALEPAKPTIDAESIYEGHPRSMDAANGYSTAQEVRSGMYNGAFAGGFGFVYGHHSTWQMYDPTKCKGINAPVKPWYLALTDEVATEAVHLRHLLESRPAARIPLEGEGEGAQRIQSTIAADGSYLMAYTGAGVPISLDLGRISGDTAQLWWFDPRTGEVSDGGTMPATGKVETSPPGEGDWALVADDAARGFPPPGPLRVEQ